MSEQKHTPDPWSAYQDGKIEFGNINHFIKSLAGDLISYGHLSKDDARRIVACVNACAGLETEMLFDLVRDGTTLQNIMRRWAICLEQRDELLAALEKICWSRPIGFRETKYSIAVETVATKAIASVKGGAS